MAFGKSLELAAILQTEVAPKDPVHVRYATADTSVGQWKMGPSPMNSDNLTVQELVQQEASRFGRFVDQKAAGHILWSYTGYPAFWRGDPETCCRSQLEEFFRKVTDGEDPGDGIE